MLWATLWIQRCEEARWAEDAARQAENVCKNDIEHFLASRDAGETRAKEAAEKVWQSSQSSSKKNDNLGGDLKYILQAMRNCGRERRKKLRRKRIWVDRRSGRGEARECDKVPVPGHFFLSLNEGGEIDIPA